MDRSEVLKAPEFDELDKYKLINEIHTVDDEAASLLLECDIKVTVVGEDAYLDIRCQSRYHKDYLDSLLPCGEHLSSDEAVIQTALEKAYGIDRWDITVEVRET